MHDDDYKKFCTSLAEMVEQVQSNLPHAKQQGFNAVGIDVSLDVAQELVQKLAIFEKLDAENDRLVNALEYVLESGAILECDAVAKARWGLGLEVENEQEIAALKPRFS
ncbi:hypothetical protein ABCL16_003432 [Vibrio parahaemolyticus]